MNNVEVQIRYECPSCKGTKQQKNPDHDPKALFPTPEMETCMHCNGEGKVMQWVDIQTLVTIAGEVLGAEEIEATFSPTA